MNIIVFGSGYIGLSLSALWAKKGHFVTAVTRSHKKFSLLSKLTQKSILYEGARDERELVLLLKNNDAIILTMTAENLHDRENIHLSTAQALKRAALQVTSPKILIYTSRDSVYGDHKGLWVDENSSLYAKDEFSKNLLNTEKTLLSLSELGWIVSIFRLGEIYGPGREISKKIWKLKDRPLPGIGKNYTNMIHQDDIVSAINFALVHKLQGIYNLVDDDHPSQKELYDKICEGYHLPLVSWNPTLPFFDSGNKRTSNHHIKASGYSFLHPHRILN